MPVIYKSRYPDVPLFERSLYTHVFSNFDRYGKNSPAFVDAPTGKTLTIGEFRKLTLRCAWGLRNGLNKKGGRNLHRGDTLMVFSPNTLAYPVIVLGAVAAGLKITPASSSYNAKELGYQFKDSGASALYVHPSLVIVALEMLRSVGVPEKDVTKAIIVDDWFAEDIIRFSRFTRLTTLLETSSLDKEETFDRNNAYETLYLCYSSGTTGLSKGVEVFNCSLLKLTKVERHLKLCHRNVTSVLDMIQPVWGDLRHKQDVMLGILPFYHIYGLVMLIHFTFLHGVPTVIMPRYEPDKFCEYIEKYKITWSLIAPPVMVHLRVHPAVDKYDLTSMKGLMSGAAPLSPELIDAVRKRFRSNGADTLIIQGYGLTETSPTLAVVPCKDHVVDAGSVGQLIPNLEARLVDETDQDAEEGKPGELWVRGPNVMKGYLNKPDATNTSITADGWFKTGDTTIRSPNGVYTIVDRKKELIKYKGYQVPPAELEGVLVTHDSIADAGVIGVWDEKQATELPRAYVVPSEDAIAHKDTLVADLHKWMSTKVAHYKQLRGGIVIAESIPKSPSGKILRRQLRDRAKVELASVSAKL